MRRLLIPLLVTLLVPIAFAAVWKFFPPKEQEQPDEERFAQLKAKYRYIQLIQLALFIITLLACTYGYYKLFNLAATLRFERFPHESLLVYAPRKTWLIPALLGSLATAFIVARVYTRFRLGSDYEEYISFDRLQSSMNPDRVTGYLSGFFIIASICSIALLSDWYSYFGQDHIRLNRFWGVGAVNYSYYDVKEVRALQKIKGPNGGLVDKAHYIILFSDGSKWDSDRSGYNDGEETDLAKNTAIIDLVTLKTGLKSLQMEFDRP